MVGVGGHGETVQGDPHKRYPAVIALRHRTTPVELNPR
jgi:hypothetical protein